ncbi:MAG: TolC family protein [Sulfurimonadaceae bacterium]|jgi:outer membrane protein TolC|nr:TolC family protein [Sulfurimonadaceae bacterium]
MKALKLLIVPFLLCRLHAEESPSLESFISTNKQELFRLEAKKVESSSNMLRDSWIAPIMLQYSHGVSEAYDNKSTTKKTLIAIDQPIFQSGGIYFGIKFAEASRRYGNYSTDVAKRKLIKEALSLLTQIRQNDLKNKKQKLLIQNALINLEFKREQYLSGQLDSTFLDDAIIEQNRAKLALLDIETQEQRLFSQLKVISDVEYETVVLPHIKLIDKKEFLQNNLLYNQAKSQSQKNYYEKNMSYSKYLPQISLNAAYNWDRIDNMNFGGQSLGGPKERTTNYATYGFKISVPININTLDDIETTRIEYLKSKIEVQDKQKEIEAMYEQVMQNIELFEKKIILSKENQEIYEKLLKDTQELFNAGYKTHYDVDLLRNSFLVQKLDVAILEYDKQLELLTLYEMVANEI